YAQRPPAADDESTVRTTLKPQVKHLKGRQTAPPTGTNTKLPTPLLAEISSASSRYGTQTSDPEPFAASHMIMREAPESVMRIGLLEDEEES
ncbi:hypothetical protein CCUS01_06542, partial [Colletotrichum cuscutae]